MVAQLGLNPVDVGLWALVGVASGIAIGMVPAVLSPHRPQEQAVATLEQAVADFATAPLPAVAKNHQAKISLANAWSALLNAGVIRGGQLVDESQSQLVQRVTRAQQRLATASGTLPPCHFRFRRRRRSPAAVISETAAAGHPPGAPGVAPRHPIRRPPALRRPAEPGNADARAPAAEH